MAETRERNKACAGYHNAFADPWRECATCGVLVRLHLNWVGAPEKQTRERNKAVLGMLRSGRRSMKHGAAPRGEPVSVGQVGERDRWKCWLCGKPVNRSARPEADDAPTLDHVQPVSHGGGFTFANLRLAHQKCNRGRGNVIGYELDCYIARLRGRPLPEPPAPTVGQTAPKSEGIVPSPQKLARTGQQRQLKVVQALVATRGADVAWFKLHVGSGVMLLERGDAAGGKAWLRALAGLPKQVSPTTTPARALELLEAAVHVELERAGATASRELLEMLERLRSTGA